MRNTLIGILTTKKIDKISAGKNFTDKRFFTDKPLTKTKNDNFCYRSEKSKILHYEDVVCIKPKIKIFSFFCIQPGQIFDYGLNF